MWEIFLKGGLMMWPLLLCSLTAATVIIERVIFYGKHRRSQDANAVQALLQRVRSGSAPGSMESENRLVRALNAGLVHPPGEVFSQAILCASERELRPYQRGLNVLDTLITLAPLLGLLGTVAGMIQTFGLLADTELGAPQAVTGGIAEALLATAFGLGVAISALVPYNLLSARAEAARKDLELAANELELLLRISSHGSKNSIPACG